MATRATPSARLLGRLRGELGLEIGPDAVVVRPRLTGRMRKAGACLWFVDDPVANARYGFCVIGSHDTVTRLLARPYLAVGWENDSLVVDGDETPFEDTWRRRFLAATPADRTVLLPPCTRRSGSGSTATNSLRG